MHMFALTTCKHIWALKMVVKLLVLFMGWVTFSRWFFFTVQVVVVAAVFSTWVYSSS
jgi:hypothetical protein